MNEENNDHIPKKNPKPDSPMDEKRVVPPGMDDKGTPMAPQLPEENEEGNVETSSPPDSGFFPETDPAEEELITFLIMMGLL